MLLVMNFEFNGFEKQSLRELKSIMLVQKERFPELEFDIACTRYFRGSNNISKKLKLHKYVASGSPFAEGAVM
jgi:hypothetical protein